MKLYLVQHGKATTGEVDPERPLTEQGRTETEKMALFLNRLNLPLDNLWHSTKKRAIQTAKILSKSVQLANPPTEKDDIGPTDDVNKSRKEIASAKQNTMVVGHLPFLTKLASLLLADSESAEIVAFKNSGIVCLQSGEDENWQIDWMVVPQLLG